MSTYVMSDLHGNYKSYKTMFEKINFQDQDMMYILGDVLDRGPNPIQIILDLMQRPNVELIAGNHCVMACECLEFLMKKITMENISLLNEEMLGKLLDWYANGAASTTKEFHQCDEATQKEIIEFISDLEVYEALEVGGRSFILVHAGLGNFSPDRPLWDYELNELVWQRPDYNTKYFENQYVITGHTPTMLIEENPRPGYIYQANNHIAIDCGCSYPGGRLGCLRLEDMQAFYVESEADEGKICIDKITQ